MEMVMEVVVERPRPRPRAEPGGEQSLLRLFGISGDEVEIGETPCRIGIAAIQLRPFHEQERTVVRLAHPREQHRRDERGGAGSSLLARETLRQLLTA